MLSSVLKGRAFAGTVALPASLRLGWLARHADAITDTLGQPLLKVGRYSRRPVAFLSREFRTATPEGLGLKSDLIGFEGSCSGGATCL